MFSIFFFEIVFGYQTGTQIEYYGGCWIGMIFAHRFLLKTIYGRYYNIFIYFMVGNIFCKKN